jgi:hypothetical protein
MKRILACLLLAFALAGCGDSPSNTASPASNAGSLSDLFAEIPDCESIVEGTELAKDFGGCVDGQTLNGVFSYDCVDGRELVMLGDEGDPWRGHAFLPGTFLSWDLHEREPWEECYGNDVEAEASSAAEPTSDAETSSAAEPTSDAEPSNSSYLLVDGSPLIPDGSPGQLSVVLIGSPDGGSVPVIVRNRTSEAVSNIVVSGTAWDSSGSLIGSGHSEGFEPGVIGPGEWAIGRVYIGWEDLPADATFDLTAGGLPGDQNVELNATVEEFNRTQGSFGDAIVGIAKNTHAVEIIGPVSVMVGCFSADGNRLISTYWAFTDVDGIPPGETASFSVDLFDDCPVLALGVSGYGY